MKAKDTVMKKQWMSREVKESQERLMLEQAEISFKAGRKEVVDWVNEYLGVVGYPPWEAQLKEWGASIERRIKYGN